MSESRTDQIIKETIDLTCEQVGLDRNVVEFVVKHHFSFLKQSMLNFKSVRSIWLGSFVVKPKYKRMFNEFGYVRSFKGTYSYFREYLIKTPEHISRMEKLDLERSRNGDTGKEKI